MDVQKANPHHSIAFISQQLDELVHRRLMCVQLDLSRTVNENIIVVIITNLFTEPLGILDEISVSNLFEMERKENQNYSFLLF